MIRTGGFDLQTNKSDGAAVRDCSATAETLAAAFLSLIRGEWGDAWMRNNLSLRTVANNLAAYQAHQQRQTKSAATRSASAFRFMEN